MRGFNAVSHLVSNFKERETIFVFGSNLDGRHGAGAARYATMYRKAQMGVGVGPTGECYALPTKGHNLAPMAWDDIQPHIQAFLRYAEDHPELTFQLTRIGCGRAGFNDWEIAPLFFMAPKNVLLPGTWRRMANPLSYYSLIVAGSRTLTDSNAVLPVIDTHVKTLQAAGHHVVIVSGGARGVDQLGERYAKEHNLKCLRFIPDWDGPQQKAAGMLRNQTMSWFGCGALCLLGTGPSPGTKGMIKLATTDGLEVTSVQL